MSLPQELCAWANRYSNWDGPTAFEPFEVLELEFDDAEYARELPRADLNAEVAAAARRFLQQSSGLES